MLAAGVACKGAAIAPALESTPRGLRLKQRLIATGMVIETISDTELTEVAATEHPQGVVAVYQPRTWLIEECAAVPRHHRGSGK